jgi:hypothetical protein
MCLYLEGQRPIREILADLVGSEIRKYLDQNFYLPSRFHVLGLPGWPKDDAQSLVPLDGKLRWSETLVAIRVDPPVRIAELLSDMKAQTMCAFT